MCLFGHDPYSLTDGKHTFIDVWQISTIHGPILPRDKMAVREKLNPLKYRLVNGVIMSRVFLHSGYYVSKYVNNRQSII